MPFDFDSPQIRTRILIEKGNRKFSNYVNCLIIAHRKPIQLSGST